MIKGREQITFESDHECITYTMTVKKPPPSYEITKYRKIERDREVSSEAWKDKWAH